MKIEDIRFGNVIEDKTNGKNYKITGGLLINGIEMVEVKQIHDEEKMRLNYILNNCEVKREWKFGNQIF